MCVRRQVCVNGTYVVRNAMDGVEWKWIDHITKIPNSFLQFSIQSKLNEKSQRGIEGSAEGIVSTVVSYAASCCLMWWKKSCFYSVKSIALLESVLYASFTRCLSVRPVVLICV